MKDEARGPAPLSCLPCSETPELDLRLWMEIVAALYYVIMPAGVGIGM